LKIGTLEEGALADITIIDPERKWKVDSTAFLSRGKNSPFNGAELKGKVVITIAAGNIVFNEI